MAKKEKWTVVSATVTQSQKEEIQRRAKESGMSMNKYVANRLLFDQDDPNDSNLIPEIDKRNYTNICMTYFLVRNIAQQLLKDPKIIEKSEKAVVDKARQKGLLPSDYQLKNNK